MGDAFNILSLFSGGGGLDLGIHRAVPGARTVVYVEREAFACELLASRMEEGALAPAPIWTDVCTFDGRPWRGVVDCVAGGSPCQDLSVAGKRAGLDGERSGLFFQFVRIVEEVRPGFVFWENVGGAASALPRVFDAFAALGYSGKAVKLRASDVGASHQRARVFLLGRLANAVGNGRVGDGRGGSSQAERGRSFDQAEGPDTHLADAAGLGRGEGRAGADAQGSTGVDGTSARAALAHGHGHGREGERGSGVLDGIGAAQRDDADGRGGAWPPRPGGDWSAVDPRFFPAQPRFRGVADGVAGGLDAAVAAVWADRLRCLGNGVVPAQAAEAWRFLRESLT